MKTVISGSPASETIIRPGDVLRKINGELINDVLDYKFYSYDSRLILEFISMDGKIKLIKLRKPAGEDIGLEFDTFLMDKQRSCANKCIFCFIDQLPKGMRETLYYKDDDVRLSLFQGNYVTLTNLSLNDVERIIKLRISPINISVHTLDPELRKFMLGTKKGSTGIDALKILAGAGIILNCQIVCCPDVNDGTELLHTMEGLLSLGNGINSVSVVPVGLTKHREGLAQLRPFDRELAAKTIRQVERFSADCVKKRGSRVFFCADEMYIKAGLKLPPHRFYEDYPQLENGVGMIRLLITEFEDALRELGPGSTPHSAFYEPFSIATGTAASGYLENLLMTTRERHGKITGKVYAVQNEFFGDSITVSGLVTGGDIIAQLKGRDLGSRLLIPQNMLRRGEDAFLDDVTVPTLSEALGVPIRIVDLNGADLLRAFLGG